MTEPQAEWVIGTPGGRLGSYIDRYIGYRLVGFPPGLHRGLPSSHLTFAVSIGPAIDVTAHPGDSQSPSTYGCVVGGLQDSHALIRHDGNQEGVAIELTPLGGRALLGGPAGELWNLSLELSELAGPAGVELWERLQGTASWTDRFAVCDQVLSRLFGEREVALPLRWCWRTLVASGGAIPVADLATELGWSRQHLTRRFRHEFGASPKVVSRVLRFERARRLLESRPARSRADIALACGYYDQPHFNREFVQFAGCTPSELLATEVPFVQDDAELDAGR